MSLVKWNNKNLFPTFFDDFFADTEALYPATANRFSQVAVNISESENAFHLELAAPGLNKEDFNIEINNQTLFINFEQEENKEENEKNYTRKEYSFNSFSRSFRLPDNTIDTDINARYENGILKVDIKKKELKEKKVLNVQVN